MTSPDWRYCFLVVATIVFAVQLWQLNKTPGLTSLSGETTVKDFDPPTCTSEQLYKIEKQLPAELCLQNGKFPWTNRCSFSFATSCPETPWLDRYLSQPQTRGEAERPFLSFFVGCNKAIDAVHALRIGSRNPRYDIRQWQTVLARAENFTESSCRQFEKYNSSTPLEGEPRPAQVYCFEPVSATFAELQRTKMELRWANELILEQAAVSSSAGSMSMPKEVLLGQEKMGIGDWKACTGSNCRQIPIYTLNDYVASMPGKPHIHFLSIDVEGYDFEVLQGASNILKDQVHYLEFEYNWKGPWANQNLLDAILMLQKQQGFVCYWPGPQNDQLWRITDCWLPHYSLRFWSNVACVNGRIPEARPLAIDMEERFLRTIEIKDLTYDHAPG